LKGSIVWRNKLQQHNMLITLIPLCALLSACFFTENHPPTANAGADKMAAIASTVILDGSLSHDVDGDKLSYHWEIIEKPNASFAILSDLTLIKPSFNLDKDGRYLIKLIVSDGRKQSKANYVSVISVNLRPVAKIKLTDESNSIFRSGEKISLHARDSFDPDNLSLNYIWELVLKPNKSTAKLSSNSNIEINFMSDVAGRYVFHLTVNDGFRLSEIVTLTIDIKPQNDNALPIPLPEINPSNSSPRFLSKNTFVISENSKEITKIKANDREGDSLEYGLLDTVDSSLFDLDRYSGKLKFINSPDFESPWDIDFNNVYLVDIWVSDGELSVSQRLSILVEDINEHPIMNSPIVMENNKGDVIDYSLNAIDPENVSLVYEVENLPPGIELDQSGRLIGKISYTSIPVYNVVVIVMDDAKNETKIEFNWIINKSSGTLTFASEHIYCSELGNGISPLALGDVNNDNFPDIVVTDGLSEEALLFLNNADGTGSFTLLPETLPTRAVIYIFIADVDGDQLTDIVFHEKFEGISWHKQLSDGTFDLVPIRLELFEALVIIDDIDNNGSNDIITLNHPTGYDIYKNDGRGNFSYTNTLASDAPLAFKLFAVDIDNNNTIDIVEPQTHLEESMARIWINDGRGNFTASSKFSIQNEFIFIHHMLSRDLNNDSYPDLAFLYSLVEPKTVIYLNDGLGNFNVASQAMVIEQSTWITKIEKIGQIGNIDNTNGNLPIPPNNNRGVNNKEHCFKGAGPSASYDIGHSKQLGDVDQDGDLDEVLGTIADIEVWINNLL